MLSLMIHAGLMFYSFDFIGPYVQILCLPNHIDVRREPMNCDVFTILDFCPILQWLDCLFELLMVLVHLISLWY